MPNDFGGVDTTFTRALARRAFIQFSTNPAPLTSIAKGVPEDVTIADASRLLSAIFFINVFPEDAAAGTPSLLPSWLYLNPRATHRLSPISVAHFRAPNPNRIYIDDFSNDDY